MSLQTTYSELFDRFSTSGQEHVFRFWDELSAEDQLKLCKRASEIDLQEVEDLVNIHLNDHGGHTEDFSTLEPAPYISLPKDDESHARWQAAEKIGEEALRNGKVAAFTVAGGQGTRLGYDGPKGTFAVTPVSGKSLFQVFAEKIIRSSEKYNSRIHWFILTSEINNEPTQSFFRENDYFGLTPDRVHFIVQGLVPAVDRNGKILLADTSTIAMTPDGHGGSLRALVRSGATRKMAELGVDCLSYFQVDNPLLPCLDPAFVGFHLLGKSECSSKMIPKAYALEKVGHFCLQDGKTVVIEYSDLPEELQQETLPDGNLRFVAGSVAIHIFDLSFIERVGGGSEIKLPFHRADKKIPFVDSTGEFVFPEEPNGIKFEMFVFDALPLAANPVIIEGERKENFSPVKNAQGVDSPETCKEDQLRQFAGWLKAAGEKIPTDESGLPEVCFEISPLFAADQKDFIEQWTKKNPKPEIRNGVVIPNG